MSHIMIRSTVQNGAAGKAGGGSIFESRIYQAIQHDINPRVLTFSRRELIASIGGGVALTQDPEGFARLSVRRDQVQAATGIHARGPSYCE